MEQMFMVINIDRCWGCKACQTACKWEYGLKPADSFPIEVFRVEQMDGNQVRCSFLPVPCLHCASPACLAACPKNAVYRDGEGLVQIRPEACIGCGACVKACPYGAMGMMSPADGRKKAVKCDLCRDRRKRGYQASCEQHCLGGALTVCSGTEKNNMIKGFPYQFQKGNTIYVSQRAAALGKCQKLPG